METDLLVQMADIQSKLKEELVSLNEQIETLKNRRTEIYKALCGNKNDVVYRGPTGSKAVPDPAFIQEVIIRRSRLKISATQLSKAAGYSASYLSMIENGNRDASDESKAAFRNILSRLENE